MAAFGDWIKDNTKGTMNKVFLGAMALDVANSENKIKALSKAIRDLVLWKPLIAVGLVGAFGALNKSIRTLLADTGSLNAAFSKMAQAKNLQRIFTPLVGSAEAAKKKVAELMNLSARSPFKFSDVGQAARSMEVFTRGAFSGAKAMTIIGDAAAKSGNGIVETADAVSGFYNALRSGAPISGASEQLRQMGIISQSTSDHLVNLQANGGSTAQVFGVLKSELQNAAGGMDALRDSIEGVNNAYDSATTSAQEAFASPFVEAEVKNTKNLTAAWVAFTPVIERVAKSYARFSQPLSTAKTSIIKAMAESETVQHGAEFVGKAAAPATAAITTGAGIYAAKSVGKLITSVAGFATGQFPAAARGIGLVATALRGLTVAALAVPVAFASFKLGVWIGEFTGLHEAIKRATGQVTKLDEAIVNTTTAVYEQVNALSKQARAIETVTQQHEAHIKALETIKSLQEQLNDPDKSPVEKRVISQALRSAQKQLTDIDSKTGLSGEELKAYYSRNASIAADEKMAILQRGAQNDPVVGQRKLEAEARRRAGEAERGALNRVAVENRTRNMTPEERDAYILKHTAATSSVNLETQARAATGVHRASLEAKAEAARQREENAPALKLEADRIRAEGRERIRDSKVQQLGAERELSESDAALHGKARELQKLGDLDTFAQNLEKARGIFGHGTPQADAQSQEYATKLTQNAISLSANRSQMSADAAVSSTELARMAGGGNIGTGGGTISVLQRQRDLQEKMTEYLKQIATSKDGNKLKP